MKVIINKISERMKDMPLTKKFYAIFGMLFTIIVLVSIVSVGGGIMLGSSLKTTEEMNAVSAKVDETVYDMRSAQQLMQGFILSGDVKLRDQIEGVIALVAKDIAELDTALVSIDANKDELESLEDIQRLFTVWETEILPEQLKYARDPYTFEMARLIQTSPRNESLWAEITKDAEHLQESIANRVAVQNELQMQGLIVMDIVVIIGAILLLLMCIVAIKLSRQMIVSPVLDISREFEKLAGYDLTGRMKVMSTDEIGKMSQGFNHLVGRLKDIVGSVREASAHMAAASEEMSSSMREMMAMGESQAEASEQISVAVRDSAKTATEISQLANNTKNSVENISHSAEDADACMKSLETNSAKIADVLGVIRDIAEQVNLLALNAAIEAARAGDAGRGFAVVAEEVRTLAANTTASTAEIDAAIKDLQGDVSRTGGALGKITGALGTINSDVHRVTEALGQQSSAVEEISATVESFSDDLRRLDNSIKEMEQVSTLISTEASRLDGQVEVFKLGEGTPLVAQQKNFNAKAYEDSHKSDDDHDDADGKAKQDKADKEKADKEKHNQESGHRPHKDEDHKSNA